MTCVSPLFNIDRLSNLTYKSILWNLKGKKWFPFQAACYFDKLFFGSMVLEDFFKNLKHHCCCHQQKKKKMTHNLSLITSKKWKHFRQIQKVVLRVVLISSFDKNDSAKKIKSILTHTCKGETEMSWIDI